MSSYHQIRVGDRVLVAPRALARLRDVATTLRLRRPSGPGAVVAKDVAAQDDLVLVRFDGDPEEWRVPSHLVELVPQRALPGVA